MRDRLIELISNYPCMSTAEDCFMESIADDLADHLLANGVIVPPCKVGDTVYFKSEYINEILSDEVENIRIQRAGITVHTVANRHLWGNEVFLTREEAEQALKGGVQE